MMDSDNEDPETQADTFSSQAYSSSQTYSGSQGCSSSQTDSSSQAFSSFQGYLGSPGTTSSSSYSSSLPLPKRKVACFKCGFLPPADYLYSRALRRFLNSDLIRLLPVFERIGIIDDFHLGIVCEWPISARAEFFKQLDGKAFSHMDAFQVMLRLKDEAEMILEELARRREQGVGVGVADGTKLSSICSDTVPLVKCSSCVYLPKVDPSIGSLISAFLETCSMIELLPAFKELDVSRDDQFAMLRRWTNDDRIEFFRVTPGVYLTEVQRFALRLGFHDWNRE
ncbi:hypothetical protein HGRIS_012846 [Hohenbuehelia grisea]|uniref:Uncharacterized protein n=1 Tax=Hohenbuehelia grisea TaxID=104357 RepID=A0ABR3ITM3_9AGAR